MVNDWKICNDHGLWRFVWPIPSTVGGVWWKRQWMWYKFLYLRVKCSFIGHKWKMNNYPYAPEPFHSLECVSCSLRVAVKATEEK